MEEYKSKLKKYEVIPNGRPNVFQDIGELLYAYELLIDLRYIFCGDMKTSEIAKEISKHSDLTESEIHGAIESIVTSGYLTLGQYE